MRLHMLCNFCCYPCLPYNLSFKSCRNTRISKKVYKVPSFPGLYFRDFLKINVFAKMSENQKNYKSGHKWSTTHRVPKSHRSKMRIIYMLSWKQCAIPVITTMALWQLMHLDTWSHCDDNREGTLFSWLIPTLITTITLITLITFFSLYIYIYIYIYIISYIHALHIISRQQLFHFLYI